MLDIAPQQVLAIIGLIFVLLELYVGVQTGFDLLIIGLILFFSGLVAPDLSVAGIFSIILALGYFFLGRKLLKNKLNKKSWDKLNTDKLIGATAIVVKSIKPTSSGLVQLGDEQWRATADSPIKSGTKVVVTNIEGITLVVETSKKWQMLRLVIIWKEFYYVYQQHAFYFIRNCSHHFSGGNQDC